MFVVHLSPPSGRGAMFLSDKIYAASLTLRIDYVHNVVAVEKNYDIEYTIFWFIMKPYKIIRHMEISINHEEDHRDRL